jgi:alpha-maltose-1-phosphate synthase
MKILLSHPTGNENVRQAVLAFSEADSLGEFWTCLAWNREGMLNRVLPAPLRAQLGRRALPEVVRSHTRTVPAREIGRLFFNLFGIDAVMQHLDRRVAVRLRTKGDFDLAYAYEDGALATFRAARELGVHRVYDLPIGYWRVAQEIYAEEQEREPAWAETLTGTRDSEEKLARKEEELQLANRIVVASSFTRETLAAAGATAPISVIPYGGPIVSPDESAHKKSDRLRVLFVGSLGQRKGLSYLLQAMEAVGPVAELTLIGRKTSEHCFPLEEATHRHRWIPTLPHEQLLGEMQRHDVLVLPSLFEGFGLVILEAMAQGLPVMTTPHTAGPDLIEEGIDGFVVPIRSSEAIAEKLDLLAAESARLTEMKAAARRKAANRPWEDYRSAMVEMAREVVLQAKEIFHGKSV